MSKKFVIDANVVFSALIKRSLPFELIISLPKIEINLYSPDFLWEEVDKRIDRLLRFSQLSLYHLNFLITFLSKRIKIVSKSEYKEFIPDAEKLLPEHKKDIPYLSVALKLSCPLWSNETRFKKQSRVKVFSTHELKKLFWFS